MSIFFFIFNNILLIYYFYSCTHYFYLNILLLSPRNYVISLFLVLPRAAVQPMSLCPPGNQHLFIMRHYRLPQTNLLQTDERMRSYSGEHILFIRKKMKNIICEADSRFICKTILYKFYTFLYICSIRSIVGVELASIS